MLLEIYESDGLAGIKIVSSSTFDSNLLYAAYRDSDSKSPEVRRPRSTAVAPFCFAYSTKSPLNEPISMFLICPSDSCKSATRSFVENSGFLLELSSTATTRRVQRRAPRVAMSICPNVTGSKLPGYIRVNYAPS